MKNFIFSIFALAMFTFVACQKDISVATVETVAANATNDVKTDDAKNVDSTINVNINVPESAGIVYVYGGKEVSASFINFTNDDLVDAFGFVANDPRHYIFDNDVELEVWANNLAAVDARKNLLDLIEDGRALKVIATNTNAVAYELANKGQAPAAYKKEANDYWEAKYGHRPIPESFGAIYNDCIAVSPLYPLNPDIVWVYPNNARNKMSYLEGIGLVGEMFASRKFLFGKKWYFWPPGNVFAKCLYGHWFNNNNESSIASF